MLFEMTFVDIMAFFDARIKRNERQEKQSGRTPSEDFPSTADDDGLEDLSHVLHVLNMSEQ